MIDSLAVTITFTCLATAVVVGVQGGTGHFRWGRWVPVLGLVEVALLVQMLLDVLGLVAGHRPRETTTHLAYLAISVLVVPVVVMQTRQDDGRWSAVLVVVSMLALTVLVVRLQTTWRSVPG